MLKLLEANGVDLNVPHDYFEWRVIQGNDEHGNTHQHIDAVTAPHESARIQADGQAINYEKVMAERAEAVAEAAESKDIAAQQETLLTMLANKVEALEVNALPLSRMSPPQLKGIAKRRGLDSTGLKTKAELIALLEG